MAWIIASIPFWLAGFFFFPCSAIVSVTQRDPGETFEDQVKQFWACVFVGGIILFIAAWMCH